MSLLLLRLPLDSAVRVSIQPAAEPRHVQRHEHGRHVLRALRACPASSLYSRVLPAHCLRRGHPTRLPAPHATLSRTPRSTRQNANGLSDANKLLIHCAWLGTAEFNWYGSVWGGLGTCSPLVQSSTGACVLQGDCVCSSNYPGGACAATSTADGQYGNDEACEVTFSGPVVLEVHLFDTEWCQYEACDPVTVNGVQYRGTDGPDGVTASSLSFASDGGTGASGFKICFAMTAMAQAEAACTCSYCGSSDDTLTSLGHPTLNCGPASDTCSSSVDTALGSGCWTDCATNCFCATQTCTPLSPSPPSAG